MTPGIAFAGMTPGIAITATVPGSILDHLAPGVDLEQHLFGRGATGDIARIERALQRQPEGAEKR